MLFARFVELHNDGNDRGAFGRIHTMSDIKSPVPRIHIGRAIPSGSAPNRQALDRLRSSTPSDVGRDSNAPTDRQPVATVLVSEFIAPPRETSEWLGNPAMPAALAAVSVELAPGGVASSKRNQYVASVVETHLAARKRLARHLNALLRA